MKTTAFDLQLNPANPGFKFHKIDRAKDKNFWSVRVNSDLRLIVHKSSGSLLLCCVDHHDKAYSWAERRRVETHPTTGAAQLVEIREVVKEVFIPVYVEAPARTLVQPALFAGLSDDQLLGFGVPADWLEDVKAATEDTILDLADHLPAEAGEALLAIAVGESPSRVKVAAPVADPFQHPDAQRRFRTITGADELAQALEYPWDRWTVFLHPTQRELVERSYSGPSRVAGSAGTGKTIVALHRAVFLARSHPDSRVLLTTFSEPLANALRVKLRRLVGSEPRLAERIDVQPLDAVARRLHKLLIGDPRLISTEAVRSLVETATANHPEHRFAAAFVLGEWNTVVDAWQLASWPDYRDVARLGRKTRLSEKQRAALWSIFDEVRAAIAASGLMTEADLYAAVSDRVTRTTELPYDYLVVDEAQDVSVAQLRLLAALGRRQPDALFFAGDLGQRIFQMPFSWKALGVDVRGRSATLKVNYRTSHQIRSQADKLLGKQTADVDGLVEDRTGTISAFNGPQPDVRIAATQSEELELVRDWLNERVAGGLQPGEISVFVRSVAEVPRATSAVAAAGLKHVVLDEKIATRPDSVSITTMHLSKGLEFRAVVVMACDDEVVPLQSRIESVTDEADLEDVYNTERHLLYVACTRARDHLLVTGVEPASEFLEDLAG